MFFSASSFWVYSFFESPVVGSETYFTSDTKLPLLSVVSNFHTVMLRFSVDDCVSSPVEELETGSRTIACSPVRVPSTTRSMELLPEVFVIVTASPIAVISLATVTVSVAVLLSLL